MAVPARRSVVFVTGNAKKLEEVRAAGAGPGQRVCICPSLPFHSILPAQVTQILGDSSPYTLVAKKIDRKLLAGRGGMQRLVPSRRAFSTAPSLCPQCPSTRGSQTRSRCRSAAKPPGRSLAVSPFPAGWVWRDPRQGHESIQTGPTRPRCSPVTCSGLCCVPPAPGGHGSSFSPGPVAAGQRVLCLLNVPELYLGRGS